MAMIRLSGLGISLLGSAILLAFIGCDSGGTTNGAPGAGGSGAGTATDTGGSSVTNGGGINTAVGGGAHTGGTHAATAATGGSGNTGNTGTGTVTAAANCKTPTAETGSFTITTSNYFKVGNYAGYGFVYISPYGQTSLTCPNSSFGSTTSALCGAGVVPADTTYNNVGGFGFNLNQPTSGGDPAPAISSPSTVSQVVVTFSNTAGTDLHIQIVQLTGTTQTNYCYEAKGVSSPVTLNAAQFTTACWSSSAPGTAWDGTGAESFQFIIPSQGTVDTTFDACIENVVIS